MVEVRNQEELERALAAAEDDIRCIGNALFIIRDSSQVTACDSSQVAAYGSSQVGAYGSSQVAAYDSSQVAAYGSSQVTAYGSSQVRACGSSQVTAYGSSQVGAYDSSQVTACGSSQVGAYDSSQVRAYDSSQVRAYGSSQVRAYDSSQVGAYDSSQVRAYGSSQVRAYDSSQVRAYDSSQVRAGKRVTIVVDEAVRDRVKLDGGHVVVVPSIRTVEDWCENYNLPTRDGTVTLFKAVDDSYQSPHGMTYAPGSMPEAPDWDGGENECGGGLHFSFAPWAAKAQFYPEAARFVACPVKLVDIAIHPNGTYPSKVKASRVCAPIWECDEDGRPLKEGSANG